MEKDFTFNDVSLLLGFKAYGRQVERKVNAFIDPLVDLLEQSGLCTGPVARKKNLYTGVNRNEVYGRVSDVHDKGYPMLFAGFTVGEGSPGIRVWLETTPGHGLRDVISRTIAEKMPELKARNELWLYDEAHRWWDAQITLPVEQLFRSDDHKQAVYNFVATALEDLKETGTITALREALEEATE